MSAFDESFERLRRRMLEIIREMEEEFERLLPNWSHTGEMEPLFSVREARDRYIVDIDLPMGELRSLSVSVKGDRLVVECNLKDEVRFHRWSAYREYGFRRYKVELKIPRDADLSKIGIEKDERRSFVRIILPKR